VLDEATASVDIETDACIQRSLRRDFGPATIVTVAHRLATVMDYDRVCVMDAGRVKEFDTPANLLRDAHSQFAAMVKETGPDSAASLWQVALAAETQRLTVNIGAP
jgi:ABC-type multidrug transport system fused ATPase/permease subunit